MYPSKKTEKQKALAPFKKGKSKTKKPKYKKGNK